MSVKSTLQSIFFAALTASILPGSQAASFQYGMTLPSGAQVVHGNGALIKDGYPATENIPTVLHVFSPGHEVDPDTPSWAGSTGFVEFDLTIRSPRHVHMAPKRDGGKKYVAEKIYVTGGVAVSELAGELFVVPPNTMVIAPAGVPHAYTAAPPGIDFKALGLSGSEELVSTGKFTAIYEYGVNTTFYPTINTAVHKKERDYSRPADLHTIQIPALTIEELKRKARFVWGREAKWLNGTSA